MYVDIVTHVPKVNGGGPGQIGAQNVGQNGGQNITPTESVKNNKTNNRTDLPANKLKNAEVLSDDEKRYTTGGENSLELGNGEYSFVDGSFIDDKNLKILKTSTKKKKKKSVNKNKKKQESEQEDKDNMIRDKTKSKEISNKSKQRNSKEKKPIYNSSDEDPAIFKDNKARKVLSKPKNKAKDDFVTCSECEEIYKTAIITNTNLPLNNFLCMKCNRLVSQATLDYYKQNYYGIVKNKESDNEEVNYDDENYLLIEENHEHESSQNKIKNVNNNKNKNIKNINEEINENKKYAEGKGYDNHSNNVNNDYKQKHKNIWKDLDQIEIENFFTFLNNKAEKKKAKTFLILFMQITEDNGEMKEMIRMEIIKDIMVIIVITNNFHWTRLRNCINI